MHFTVAEKADVTPAQVVSDPNMNKSGTYWSWSDSKGSFENVVSEEVKPHAFLVLDLYAAECRVMPNARPSSLMSDATQ